MSEIELLGVTHNFLAVFKAEELNTEARIQVSFTSYLCVLAE